MNIYWTITLWVVAVLFMLAGIVGAVLPALPGPPLVFCGFFLAAWIDNFEKIGPFTLTVLGFLTLVAVGVDIAAACKK